MGRERSEIVLRKVEAKLNSGAKKAFRALPDNWQPNAGPKPSFAVTSCFLAAANLSIEFILPAALSSSAALANSPIAAPAYGASSGPFARASVKSDGRGFSTRNSRFFPHNASYSGCRFPLKLNHKPGFAASVVSNRLL